MAAGLTATAACGGGGGGGERLDADAGYDAGGGDGDAALGGDAGNQGDSQVPQVPGPHVIGGSVSGLADGASLVLQNNGSDNLTLSANGTFQFPATVDTTGAYAVSVLTQPTSPSQTCMVSKGAGTVGFADVTDVAVVCTTDGFAVGGSVVGLSGSITLQNNGGDDLVVGADGPFAFSTHAASGAAYAVTVLTQPEGSNCVVSGGTGTVGAGDVQSITVNCASDLFTIGGNVSGLDGGTLIVANSGGNELTLTANGSFAFSTPLATTTAYDVTVVAQPVGQTCTVANGSGAVAGANVTNVQVTCTTATYKVGGTLVGLAASGSATLQNNGADDLTLNADGSFAFATKLESGASYNVSVSTQPTGTVCTVSGGTGSVGDADVSSVVVNCAKDLFTVGGSVTGLTGNLVLQNNGGDNLTLSADGSFAFATPLASGASYAVTVQHQPTGQTCIVSSGNGKVGTSNVTGVSVSCVSNTHKLGGTVTGLKAGMVLANNGGDLLQVSVDGAFTFKTLIATGSIYSVTVKNQPVGQSCSVQNGVGVAPDADVTNIVITCTDRLYKVGGVAIGLGGGSLVLQNNGGDNLTVSANGQYHFATALPKGSMYKVTVLTVPANRTCSVNNDSGTIGSANVVNVVVSCQPAVP
ncbi:MAG: hypothetical protein QM778_16740 [Myxococcales bacterium]